MPDPINIGLPNRVMVADGEAGTWRWEQARHGTRSAAGALSMGQMIHSWLPGLLLRVLL
ncbi:hypothetical protein HDA35_002312 [Micromonospora purpureochromogenes]|uniref:Uncharacterized protein n=1 Tax=Micromonospora purpureochromogenes TaxID=47872 RepID=A0ABX2RJF3_9ACTN|nr:hypothetical protein [Micromonospora purpureochromogenes]